MEDALTPDERQQISLMLNPAEEELWQGRSLAASRREVASPVGLVQRLRSWFGAKAPRPLVEAELSHLYVLTNKRVIDTLGGKLVQEWPLMLGMVQKVELREDASGDIVFDYAPGAAAGMLLPCGILQVADVAGVQAKLAAAIDAAYLASPWT